MGDFQQMDIAALRSGTVDDLKARLETLDLPTLQAVRDAEVAEGEGKTRRTAIAAIDDAIGKRMVRDGEAGLNPTARNEDELQALVAAGAGTSPTATDDAALERMASPTGCAA